ncbi:fibrocystin [Eleutherodactylus coqui]|uniref:fibrocystin n=1 Tax=Eleutherodactylus coqui TaxID=57060 RepID=UPI00346377D8
MKELQKPFLNSGGIYMLVPQLLFAVVCGMTYTAYPLVGSTAGGTLITILFNDSNMENQHLVYVGNGPHLEVHMTSPQRPPVICDVLLSFMPSVQCKTRPQRHEEESYELQVYHDGQPVIQTTVITYKFSSAQTPEIREVGPSCGVPGGIIELSGKILTSNYEDYDFNVDFIEGPIILTSDRDGRRSVCTLGDKISDTIYLIHVEGDIGKLRCRAEGSYIGSQNITFSVFNKGKSRVSKEAWSISAKQELFLYQTFPVVRSVYPDVGGAGGGTDITITGDFFMDPAEVSISGNVCKIKSLSPQVIVCSTAPYGQYVDAPYPGNRGLLYEMWVGSQAPDTDKLSLQQRSVVLTASSPADGVLAPGQPFRARLSGFFVSPETNNYTFWIQSDCEAQLFISQSQEHDAKVEIASIPHGITTWTEHWELDWDIHWKQKSSKMELVQGKKYYIEMLQHGAGPNSSMKMGVQIHNTWLNPEVVNMYQREKHQIVATSAWIPDIQKLTFDGLGPIRFCWGNTSSQVIYTNSSADEIQAVIEDMISVHCDSDVSSKDLLLYLGFEDGMNITNTEGERSAWAEPYCGRYSVFMPKYILKGPQSTPASYELNIYHYVCFGYKGYLDDYLLVSLTYNNSFLNMVMKNLICQWKFNENSPERWNYGCTNLWVCLQDSLSDVHRKSSIYVDQILLLQTENEMKRWYFIDEVIITNRSTTVYRIDPKQALPGGHHLISATITGSYPSYNLTTLVANCGINLPLIELCGVLIQSGGDHHHVQMPRIDGEDIILDVMRLQAASPPIGGTFSVNLSGTIIPGIPVHISSDHLRELLTGNTDDFTRPYINVTDFTITKDLNTCHKIVWTLTWKNMTGDLPNFLQVSAEHLTGLEPSIITRVVYDGGVIIWPVFGDMLASSNLLPQVIVHVNDIPAQCSGSCSFQHLLNITPIVRDIQYTAGVGCNFIVNILGSGFRGSALELDVKINETDCSITEANTSSIVCCINTFLPLGEHQVYVHVKSQGFATNENGSNIFLHVTPKLSALLPSVIPQTGGQIVTLEGVRFDGAIAVAFGSKLCPVHTSTSTTVTCIAPPQSGDVSEMDVRIKIEQRWISFQKWIQFDSSRNPVILSITPNTSSSADNQVVFINLSNFDKMVHMKMEVTVDTAVARIVNATSQGMEVTLPPLPPGRYNVSVILNGVSLLANGFQPIIRYVLETYNLEPRCGSFLGGTIINIYGKGFGSNTSLISVHVGQEPCAVLKATDAIITCQTPPYPFVELNEENITVPLNISIANRTGKKVICDSPITGEGDLTFTYHRDFTPTISSLSWFTENGSLWLCLTGANVTDSVILFESVQSKVEYEITYQDLQNLGFAIPLDHFSVGKYSMKVYQANRGFANITSEKTLFELEPQVFSLSPREGPSCGGIILSLSGHFYQIRNTSVLVNISGNYECILLSVSNDTINCVLKVNSLLNLSIPAYIHVSVIVNDITGLCQANCTLTLVPEQTPRINSVLPTLQRTTLVLHIFGERLSKNLHMVVDGSQGCYMVSWNETLVICQLEDTISPGTHTVSFPFAGDGHSCLSLKPYHFFIKPQITEFYPQYFGVNGGGSLTIEGSGLQGRNSTLVLLANVHQCKITSANNTVIRCIVPPENGTMNMTIQVDNESYTAGNFYLGELHTPKVHSTLQNGLTLSFEVSGMSSTDHVDFMVGNYKCTNVSGNCSWVQCSIPQLPAGNYEIKCLDSQRGWATSNITLAIPLQLNSVRNNIDCMDDRTLHITGTGFSPGNTSVTICGSPCKVSDSLTTATDLYCSNWKLNSSWSFLCDLMFEAGAQCHEKRNTFIQCDVTVRVGALLVTRSLAYVHICHCNWEYDARLMPVDNGTAHVTQINGLLVSPKVEEDEVLIYNGSCSIAIATEAEMECKALNQPITTQITAIRKNWLQNTQGSHISLHFCSLWSRNSSWPSGFPPRDGDNVTVERGRTLLLADGTSLLNLLHIKGGKVIFTGSGYVHLQAHYILISDGGELQAGTASQPFKGKADITLHGSASSAPLYPYGVKFLAVRNASISIHGWVPKFISTKLAYPARANDTQLTVMDPVDWRVGDQFVLCGSNFYGPVKQEELLTVVNVNDTQVSISPPLRYAYDIIDQPIKGEYVSLRPLVALLSRDITIQGNLTDEYISRYKRCQEAGVLDIAECPYETSETTLGSQDLGMVFVAQALKDEPSLVHISGVRFLHAGQAFTQSRCALNIAGSSPMFGSYIRRCVVVNSFARGISLSGISHFTVEENIFYNIKGHGVIVGEHLEDAIQVKRNLLIRILGVNGLSNIETLAAAAIYIRSPSNAIEENTVCGSGYGYFYHLSLEGPSQAPLDTFRKNTAVSCKRSGFRLHPEYQPPVRDTLTVFQDFTAWESRGGAQIARCGNVSFKDFKIFSCEEFGINISESAGNLEVSDSLLLGHFDGEESRCMTSGIVTPKRYQAAITNTTFINFDRQACSAVRTCSGCTVGQGGFTVKTQKLTFLNSPRKVFFPYPHCSLIEDIDGSVSGLEGSHLLVDTGILPDSSCWAGDYISGGASGRVCEADITFHRMSVALERAPSVGYNITIRNSRNQTSTVNYVPDTLSNLYGWQALLLDTETYTIIFHVPQVQSILQYSTTFDDFLDGDYLYIRHIDLPSILNISITCGSRVGKPHQSIPLPTESDACAWYFDSKHGTLSYLVAGKGQVRVNLTAEEMSVQPTPTPTPGPHPVLRWSSPESWAGVGEGWGGYGSTIPQAGDDVIILPNRTIIVDIVLPPLRGLYVVGALEFPPNFSNELTVACLLIAGGRLSVGTSQQPLQREQRIRILLQTSTGIHCDRFKGLHVSPGVIGIYGKLQIYSAYPSKSWTRLGADIASGNEMIPLNRTVDWRPGDEVVISSSSYEAHQAERVYLRDIYGTIVRIWGKLNHWHSGTVHSIGDSWRIPLTAEVGLLSRNVQIDTDTSCSGTIMVGQYVNDLGEEYLGSLELSNVEISNFGSSSFPSIHFNNTSQSSVISSSSIHHSCGGGIRATNTTNISLHANLLYNTVGHGIELDGGNHILTDNLLILMKQPKTQVDWVAGVKINPSSQAFLSGNSVAGSERIAYHVQGQRCHPEERSWLENVAHSSLHGIHIYWENGLKNCTKIAGFLSYKNYDYGIFFHVEGNVVVDNVALIDNTVGLLPIVSQVSVYPCGSLNSISVHSSVIVATSSAFDCLRDRMKPFSANVTLRDRAPSSPFSGRVGILWPVFTVKPRQWPDYPWHMLAGDGAVSGIMKLQDVTFSGFKKSCYSDDIDTCIMSNPGNMAISCPITAERTKTCDIRPDHIFYFHPPDRSTGCLLSTECSGAQAALFKDLDGSFLGLSPPVTVFPKSELDVIHPCYNVGIYKEDDLCSYNSESQAHTCQQIDHTVVVLEVIADITQSITPVLSVTNNFIQMFVSGQNTQEKTFYSILPAKRMSKVCFSGPTPKAIRLRLNGCQNSTKLILALFYDVPNSFYIVWRGRKYSTIIYDSEPKFQSNDQISSFFSFRENLLYIVLQGNEPVEIWTNLSIHLFFYVALGAIKDLYDQLPSKLATFLSIAPSQVTVVQNLQGRAVTLEAMMDNHSKRKRHCPPVLEERRRVKRHSEPPLTVDHERHRQESLIEVLVVEIHDFASPEELSTTASLTYGNLQNIATDIIGALQTGELEKVIDMHIESLMVIEPTPWNNSSSSAGSRSAVYMRPHEIHIAVQPVGGMAGASLPVQPKVVFLDIKGNRVVNLGHFSNPWKVSAYLKGSSGGPLKGSTTLVIEDGWGNFSNLAVSSSGSNWCLIFNVTSPAGVALSVQSKEFQVFVSKSSDKENVFMLVVLSSAASAIVLLLFVCFFFKRKKVEKSIVDWYGSVSWDRSAVQRTGALAVNVKFACNTKPGH